MYYSTLPNISTKFGPFEFDKVKGELPPGQFDAINVRFVSLTTGQFNEKFNVSALNCLPTEDQKISLIAEVSVAELCFKNYHEIFSDSHVVDSLDDFCCSNKVSFSRA